VLIIVLLNQEINQLWNILGVIDETGHIDADDIDSIVEVLAEVTIASRPEPSLCIPRK
jgi:hypothetical protein